MTSRAFVYFLRDRTAARVKIGRSNNPLRRRASFPQDIDLSASAQIGFPTDEDAVRAERILHAWFDRFRMHPDDIGRCDGYTEWFHADVMPAVESFLTEHADVLRCTAAGPIADKASTPARPRPVRAQQPLLSQAQARSMAASLLVAARFVRRAAQRHGPRIRPGKGRGLDLVFRCTGATDDIESSIERLLNLDLAYRNGGVRLATSVTICDGCFSVGLAPGAHLTSFLDRSGIAGDPASAPLYSALIRPALDQYMRALRACGG